MAFRSADTAVTMKGIPETLRNFQTLNEKEIKKIMTRVVKKAAVPVKKEIQRTQPGPKDSEFVRGLRDSITISSPQKPKRPARRGFSGDIIIGVGAKLQAGMPYGVRRKKFVRFDKVAMAFEFDWRGTFAHLYHLRASQQVAPQTRRIMDLQLALEARKLRFKKTL